MEKDLDYVKAHFLIEDDKLSKLMDVAFEELNSEQFESAEKHFSEAYVMNPNLYLLDFFKVYCKCQTGKRGEIPSQYGMVISVTKKTFSKIKADESLDSKDNCYSMVMRSYFEIADLFWTNAVEGGYKMLLGFIDTTFELVDLTGSSSLSGYSETKEVVINWLSKYRKASPDYKTKIDNKLKELDDTYTPPVETKKGGCYVATCVYGSYDCPQVWTLRRFRDYKLGTTWHGRLFIKMYYAISPTLVKWFGKTNWFKKMWKGKLDHMVEKYKKEGFEDTPYDDINW